MCLVVSSESSKDHEKKVRFADALMVRNIDQKMIIRELSISFLRARGGRNKALE